jgi:membrane-bound serine protease (ClpP class)
MKNPILLSAALLLLLPAFLFGREKEPVYIIPIEGEIEKGLVWVVRRGIREAEENQAGAIILEMNTPGGKVDATEEIMDSLLKTPIPTYTYVNTRALSAGAYIAVATKHIYMAPGSTIGAATPIAALPLQGPVDMPEAVEEKFTSALRATIATTAEQNGHPVKIAEAMVDRDVEIPGVIEKGKLLTLTNKKAESEKVALSEGTLESLEKLMEVIGLKKSPRVRVKITPTEKLARFIKTPGFGFPGILGITLLALFFFGHYIAGLAGYEEVVLFIIGVVLLSIELFVTPGFGILGGSGIILIIVSFIAAMGKGPFFNPATILSPNYFRGLTNFGTALLGLVILILLTYKFVFVKSSPLYQKFVLTAEERRANGFESSESDLARMKGMRGTAVSNLRPAGKANINGKTVDVVSRGDFIEPGDTIEVVEVVGNRVVVRREVRS